MSIAATVAAFSEDVAKLHESAQNLSVTFRDMVKSSSSFYLCGQTSQILFKVVNFNESFVVTYEKVRITIRKDVIYLNCTKATQEIDVLK